MEQNPLSTLEIGTKNETLKKTEVSRLIPISWFNSCIYSLFSGMTLALHNYRVHCSGVMQEWACISLRSALWLAEARCEVDCSTVGLYCVTITSQQIFKVHFKLQ